MKKWGGEREREREMERKKKYVGREGNIKVKKREIYIQIKKDISCILLKSL